VSDAGLPPSNEHADPHFDGETQALDKFAKGRLSELSFSMDSIFGRMFSRTRQSSTVLRRMMSVDKLKTRDVLRLISRTKFEYDPAVVRSWIKYASPEKHLAPYSPTILGAIVSGRYFEARERKAVKDEFAENIVKLGADGDVVEVAKAICRQVEASSPLGYAPEDATAFLFELNMALIPMIVSENDPKAFDAVLADLTDALLMKFHKRPAEAKLH